MGARVINHLNHYQVLVLAVLLRSPAHPYAIRLDILEFSDHHKMDISRSTLQRTLKGLGEASLIEESDGGNYWLHRRRGVPYQITELGRIKLEGELIKYLNMIRLYKLWLTEYEILKLKKLYPRYIVTALRELPVPDDATAYWAMK